MSKLVQATIRCPSCRQEFEATLYRTLWIEEELNRGLVFEDRANRLRCSKCDHQWRAEFPLLCSNVKKDLAVWYEPYRDAAIDQDIAMYRTTMGDDSFYATAPRVSNWEEFKSVIRALESGSKARVDPECSEFRCALSLATEASMVRVVSGTPSRVVLRMSDGFCSILADERKFVVRKGRTGFLGKILAAGELASEPLLRIQRVFAPHMDRGHGPTAAISVLTVAAYLAESRSALASLIRDFRGTGSVVDKIWASWNALPESSRTEILHRAPASLAGLGSGTAQPNLPIAEKKSKAPFREPKEASSVLDRANERLAQMSPEQRCEFQARAKRLYDVLFSGPVSDLSRVVDRCARELSVPLSEGMKLAGEVNVLVAALSSNPALTASLTAYALAEASLGVQPQSVSRTRRFSELRDLMPKFCAQLVTDFASQYVAQKVVDGIVTPVSAPLIESGLREFREIAERIANAVNQGDVRPFEALYGKLNRMRNAWQEDGSLKSDALDSIHSVYAPLLREAYGKIYEAVGKL